METETKIRMMYMSMDITISDYLEYALKYRTNQSSSHAKGIIWGMMKGLYMAEVITFEEKDAIDDMMGGIFNDINTRC